MKWNAFGPGSKPQQPKLLKEYNKSEQASQHQKRHKDPEEQDKITRRHRNPSTQKVAQTAKLERQRSSKLLRKSATTGNRTIVVASRLHAQIHHHVHIRRRGHPKIACTLCPASAEVQAPAPSPATKAGTHRSYRDTR
jgi:hypothetical protein